MLCCCIGPRHHTDLQSIGAAEEEDGTGMQPFTRLTKAAVEALRYRAEDIARSITKSVVKEVRACSPL